MKSKVLHLTLKKKWFDSIARGEKNEEYRVVKPYWTSRLIKSSGIVIIFRSFDEIHFRNGYSNNSPFMRTRYCYTEIREMVQPDSGIKSQCFCIGIGNIIEIKNWKPKERDLPSYGTHSAMVSE